MKTRSLKVLSLAAVAGVAFALGYLAKDLFLDILLGGSLF